MKPKYCYKVVRKKYNGTYASFNADYSSHSKKFYEIEYPVNKLVIAYPNTMGIFVFKRLIDAEAFKNKFGNRHQLAIFKCIYTEKFKKQEIVPDMSYVTNILRSLDKLQERSLIWIKSRKLADILNHNYTIVEGTYVTNSITMIKEVTYG